MLNWVVVDIVFLSSLEFQRPIVNIMLICLLSGNFRVSWIENVEGAQIKAKAAQISILCLYISEGVIRKT